MRSLRPLAALAGAAVLAIVAGAPLAAAQDRWSWPEHSQELRVLPRETDAKTLRATMTGFSGALGVRCSHCHVGKEGTSFTQWDFVSDGNPNKERARGMMRMLADVRAQLTEIGSSGPSPVEMTCATCHRGVARPMRLPDALWETYQAEGVDAAVSEYHALRARYQVRGAYDFGEASLNELGYRVLETGDATGAAALLAMNAEAFPLSANAWDSLAEANLAAGDTLQAKAHYAKTLELDPDHAGARLKLQHLGVLR